MTNENLKPVAFQFSASNQEISSVLIDNEPFFIAKDICKVLGLSNTSVAISTLDEDEKADVSISYTSSNGITQNRKVKVISESGLYALIMRSSKPEARTFRKWVTKEVLPAIRKKGYYGTAYATSTYIDLRNVPLFKRELNGFPLRGITYQDEDWYSLVDVHRCIGSQTCVTQVVKRLNVIEPLALKVWVFGATHPAWYTNFLGLQLVLGSSRVFKNDVEQLKLSL